MNDLPRHHQQKKSEKGTHARTEKPPQEQEQGKQVNQRGATDQECIRGSCVCQEMGIPWLCELVKPIPDARGRHGARADERLRIKPYDKGDRCNNCTANEPVAFGIDHLLAPVSSSASSRKRRRSNLPVPRYGNASIRTKLSARGFHSAGKSAFAKFSRIAARSSSATVVSTISRSPFFSSGTPVTANTCSVACAIS